MRVRVLFFGILKELVGKPADPIDLPERASVRDVLARYESQIPRLKESLPSLALAVNQQYAGPDTKLQPNDEIALLPPVSGGAPERQADGRRDAGATLRSSAKRLTPSRLLAGLKRGEDGAALVFEGVVRNQTRGRKTLYLDYEAYEEMALEQMESLADASCATVSDSRRGHGPPPGSARNRRDQRADRGGLARIARPPLTPADGSSTRSSARYPSGRKSTLKTGRFGPTESRFRRRFRAQIPEQSDTQASISGTHLGGSHRANLLRFPDGTARRAILRAIDRF